MAQNLLIRNILCVYLPITILVSLTSTVATFINTFLTAIWLNGEDVVLISVPSYLSWFIAISGSMVATGSSVIFSRYLAYGHREQATNTYNIALVTGVALGILFLVICQIYAFLILQGDTPLSDTISAEYVSAIGLSAIPLLLLQILIMFLRMDNDRYLALTCFAVYIIIDIASVWITVHDGLGPFGVGISVGIGSVVALMLTPLHLRIKDRCIALVAPTNLWKGVKRMSKIGFRSLLNRISMTLRYYFLNLFISTSGIVVTGCLTAQSSVLHLLVPIFTGCAIMSSILCGTFYPLGDRRSLNDSVRELSKASLVITLAMTILILILSEDITNLLVTDIDKRPAALSCLRWFALCIPTTSLCMILAYMYHATKRKTMSNLLIIYRGVVLIMIIVLTLTPIIDENAIWISFLSADLLMLATLLIISAILNHRFPRTIDDMMMLKGKQYKEPPIYDASIHNNKDELKSILPDIKRTLTENGYNEDTVSSAVDKIESVIEKTIDNGYMDSQTHQIDILIRKDKGLNIVIKDNSTGKIEISEGITQAKSLDLNIYYINFDAKEGAA